MVEAGKTTSKISRLVLLVFGAQAAPPLVVLSRVPFAPTAKPSVPALSTKKTALRFSVVPEVWSCQSAKAAADKNVHRTNRPTNSLFFTVLQFYTVVNGDATLFVHLFFIAY